MSNGDDDTLTSLTMRGTTAFVKAVANALLETDEALPTSPRLSAEVAVLVRHQADDLYFTMVDGTDDRLTLISLMQLWGELTSDSAMDAWVNSKFQSR